MWTTNHSDVIICNTFHSRHAHSTQFACKMYYILIVIHTFRRCRSMRYAICIFTPTSVECVRLARQHKYFDSNECQSPCPSHTQAEFTGSNENRIFEYSLYIWKYQLNITSVYYSFHDKFIDDASKRTGATIVEDQMCNIDANTSLRGPTSPVSPCAGLSTSLEDIFNQMQCNYECPHFPSAVSYNLMLPEYYKYHIGGIRTDNDRRCRVKIHEIHEIVVTIGCNRLRHLAILPMMTTSVVISFWSMVQCWDKFEIARAKVWV